YIRLALSRNGRKQGVGSGESGVGDGQNIDRTVGTQLAPPVSFVPTDAPHPPTPAPTPQGGRGERRRACFFLPSLWGKECRAKLGRMGGNGACSARFTRPADAPHPRPLPPRKRREGEQAIAFGHMGDRFLMAWAGRCDATPHPWPLSLLRLRRGERGTRLALRRSGASSARMAFATPHSLLPALANR